MQQLQQGVSRKFASPDRRIAPSGSIRTTTWASGPLRYAYFMVARYEDALAVIGALDARQLQQIRPGRPRRELAVLGRNAEAEATRKRTGLHFRRPQLRVKETVMLWGLWYYDTSSV
jgi:hypothetical protein